MLNGNFEAAVDCCLKAGRLADALVLAASGPELWTATRDKYLQTAQTPFMRMLGAVVHEDFAGYVGASSLATWRETLALLNTYAGPTELSPLCNQLGDRLHAERGDSAAATVCYMCAANVEKVTELWSEHHFGNGADASADGVASLLDFMEKLVVFQEAAQTKQGYALVSAKVCEFAELLASQGCLPAAMGYLLHLPQETYDPKAATLVDRIYGQQPALLTGPPPAPFERVHVEAVAAPAPAPAPAPAAAAAGYGQQGYGQQGYTRAATASSRATASRATASRATAAAGYDQSGGGQQRATASSRATASRGTASRVRPAGVRAGTGARARARAAGAPPQPARTPAPAPARAGGLLGDDALARAGAGARVCVHGAAGAAAAPRPAAPPGAPPVAAAPPPAAAAYQYAGQQAAPPPRRRTSGRRRRRRRRPRRLRRRTTRRR